MADILIIDDDPIICDVLVQMMERIHHQARFALTGSHGRDLAKNNFFDIIFLDVNLPDANGLDLIKELKTTAAFPEIIIITGENNPNGAELAISSGAWNYLEKPFFRQEINLQVKRALQFRREKGRVSRFGGLNRSRIIGESEEIQSCLEQVSVAAHSDLPVLISGEPGTGKELFAKTIHLNSDRGENNFVIVNCSVMNEVVADKLLFGSVDRLENGRKSCRPGLVAMADKGTLFLDDISRLPLAIQRSLCRAMEQQTFVPVGGDHPEPSDFRVVAVTRQDGDNGRFQTDFLTRFKGMSIHLPSLRQRQQDIVAIAIYQMDRYCKKYGIVSKGISPECLGLVNAYSWPGNVQELNDAMGKAVVSAKNEPTLYSVHLPSYIKANITQQETSKKGYPGHGNDCFKDGFLPLKAFTKQWEQYYLEHLFSHVDRDVQKACEIAGMSRASIYARLKRYNIN